MYFLEIGNTTAKIATVADDGKIVVERFGRDDEELWNRLGLAGTIVCAVTGRATGPSGEGRLDPARVRLLRIDDFAEFIDGRYTTSRTLGLDRVLNLYGVRGDAVVVSCGTAVTVDAVCGSGPVFGAIMPGFRTAAAGLHARVPSLPLIDPGTDPPHFPARTSIESVSNGILLGTAWAARALAAELGRVALDDASPRIILTGGDAELMRQLWPGDGTTGVDDALLFRGMQNRILEQ